jgi:hypothetical protein
MTFRTTLGSAAIALLILWSATASAAPDAATVLTFKGDCSVEADGHSTILKLNDPVPVGATVVVPDGAKLKLRMVDGSVVSVASGSRLTIAVATSRPEMRDVELSLATGLLRAVVTPAAPNSRFEVDTAVGVAAVRSTDWFVRTGAGAMQVGVLSGVVNMESHATKHSVNIPANWGSRLEAGKDPVRPRRWEQSEFDQVIALTALE